MAYQVTARKWRPQNFQEVIHQDHVSRTLQNSIAQGRISHAYIFSGPRGVGKTTMARVLAKSLNCLQNDAPTQAPCGVCENCLEIRDGNSFDVIEIDGASNNGVEDIRDLREKVHFAPVKSRYKVYIIDEVHMVTTQAFNALLKTLEEPPPHVVFVLATTEYHKIPDTIASRCQKFFFKQIPLEVIASHLKTIVEKEGYAIDEKALYPLARAAGGSMRDAQSLLDQVISYGKDDGTLDAEDALAILGIVSIDTYVEIFTHIDERNRELLLQTVDGVVELGVNIARFVDGLIEIIRALRFLRGGVVSASILGLSSVEQEALSEKAARFSDEDLASFYRVAADCVRDIRTGAGDRIPLEMALLDMITVLESPSLAGIIDRLEKSGVEKKKNDIVAPVESAGEPPAKTVTARTVVPDKALWATILQRIEELQPSLYPVLSEIEASVTGDVITLAVAAGPSASYHYRKLDRSMQELIEKIATEAAARTIKVRVTEPVAAVVENQEMPLPPEEGQEPPPVEESVDEKSSTAVKKVLDAFHGQIIEKE